MRKTPFARTGAECKSGAYVFGFGSTWVASSHPFAVHAPALAVAGPIRFRFLSQLDISPAPVSSMFIAVDDVVARALPCFSCCHVLGDFGVSDARTRHLLCARGSEVASLTHPRALLWKSRCGGSGVRCLRHRSVSASHWMLREGQ